MSTEKNISDEKLFWKIAVTGQNAKVQIFTFTLLVFTLYSYLVL